MGIIREIALNNKCKRRIKTNLNIDDWYLKGNG